MVNNKDFTFITNQDGKTLLERFQNLIRYTSFFDCLVGYFYSSGFYQLYPFLEEAQKIRILIGMGTDLETFLSIEESHKFSEKEVKEQISERISKEFENSKDTLETEKGMHKFIEWIRNKKIEIRAYPNRNLHAKLYILTFKEEDRDIGRVITGSSNFTISGLSENLEFNVELKSRFDYEFAKSKFDELWNESFEISQDYVNIIENRTWLNDKITPYELYLKFLYEYFKEELERKEDIFSKYLPEDFKNFEYQEQAVLNAKKILEEYGGVFISDVVGLGKTYISAMLISQLDGRTMIIAPPALLDETNPGSWKNVFSDFRIAANYVSIGKLDDAIELVKNREYKNIIIDEAHRFRSGTTQSYEKLSEICRGKRVILVTATPYNNSPNDILALIGLFQNRRKSTIPGMSNLESFFNNLENNLKKIDRQKNYHQYLEVIRKNAKEIREKVLKYLMVRRTRTEIEKYFSNDLKKNQIQFPDAEAPKPFYYQLNEEEDQIFMDTIRIITQGFHYARYMPLVYIEKQKEDISPLEEQGQRNLAGFMKTLLVKRLESSFYAFRNTLKRFIESYRNFIKVYEQGNVYISKGYINKIFEYLEEDDDESIQKLIENEKAQKYEREYFKFEFGEHLKKDLKTLETIHAMWENIKRDPKLQTLLEKLESLLKNHKIVIFTESKETAEYLQTNINQKLGEIALCFYGGASNSLKEKVIENFDARAKNQKDDYKILITTDVLSEGVNLHRSNVVINYDIPWNPTKLMQRVGRINRINSPFKKIYTYNFFPTKQADSEIELTNIARSKIEAFLTLLGGDASILTEGEPVSSHELFNKLLSKKIITEEEEESELKYLRVIEDVKEQDPQLFEKIKTFPKKARSAKGFSESLNEWISPNSLITFFKKGKLMKFFIADKKESKEIDFIQAAKILESSREEMPVKISLDDYYNLFDKNRFAFLNTIFEEKRQPRGSRNARELLKILKISQNSKNEFTKEQGEFLSQLIEQLEEGALPERTIKRSIHALDKLKENIKNPIEVVNVLQKEIQSYLLKNHYAENSALTEQKTEVILSLFISGKKK